MSDQIYDDLDPMYRAIWGTSLHHGYWKSDKESADEARENLIQEIFKHWQPSGHIADIGCGYGTLAHRIVLNFKCSVTACTPSLKQAGIIPPLQGLTALQGDWLEQNLHAQSFDAAISLESTSHFGNFEPLLKKTYETLKPGATWVIADWFSPDGNTLLLKHLAKTGDLPPWRSLPSFLHAARECGFSVKETKNFSSQVAPTWSALFRKSLLLPLKNPILIPKILLQILRRPSLLWAFPLIRLAYLNKSLSYHLIQLTRT